MAVTDWPTPQRRRLCRVLWAVAGSLLLADLAVAIVTLSNRSPSRAMSSPVLAQPAVEVPKAGGATGTLAQYAAVWQRDVSADFTPPPPPKPEPKPEPPPPPNLTLKALLRDSQRPVAIVAGPDGQPVVLPWGIEHHGLRLIEVQPRAAVVGYEGQTLRLELSAETLPVHIEETALTARTGNPPHAQDAKP